MKILSLFVAMFVLLSMATSVVAMPANGWHKAAVAPVTNSAIDMPAIGITFPISFGSEGSNTMSRGLGTFEIVGSSFGSFTDTKNLAPGIYTIKFTPRAGFQFDSFRLVDGVQKYLAISTSGSVLDNTVSTGTTPMPSTPGGPVYSLPAPVHNTASAQVGNSNVASSDMIAIGNGPQPAYITVQVTGPGSVFAYAADVQAPTVSTAGGTYVSYGGPMYVTITANVADNDPMYPPQVKLTIDGTDYTMDQTSPGNYEYSLSLAPGTHAYTVEATDAAGLVTTKSSSVLVNTVTIGDTQAPTVSITAPTSNVNTGSVTITATATDNVGVSSVTLAVNGNTYTMASSGSNSYSYTVSLSAGSYPVIVTAIDAANNAGTASATINVVNPNNGGNNGGYTGGGSYTGGSTSGSTVPVTMTPVKKTVQKTAPVVVLPKAETTVYAQPVQTISFWKSKVVQLIGLNLILLILLLVLIFGMR